MYHGRSIVHVVALFLLGREAAEVELAGRTGPRTCPTGPSGRCRGPGPTPTMSIASSVPGATGRSHSTSAPIDEMLRSFTSTVSPSIEVDRAAHQAVARLAGAGEAVGLDRHAVGELARDFGSARLPEDIALDHADAELADQLQVVVSLDALGAGVHAERLGEGDDGADDRRVAVGRSTRRRGRSSGRS